MKHIEFAKLIQKFEGLRSSDEQEISEHLLVCADCTLLQKKIAGFFNYVEFEKSANVAQSVTANLLNIYQPKKTAPKKEGLVKRIFGELVFDDWQFALNERLAFSDTRQMLYKVEDIEIDLRFQFINGKCFVSGQIFPDLKEKGKVKLIFESGQTETELNENREFGFPPLPEGVYALEIHLNNVYIEISELSLRI
jgi:hypothetical protein